MTGSPSSVAPESYPTAVSWGYPHLEVFAVSNNERYSIYRKYRNSNAASDCDFQSDGSTMKLVGGHITLPSIAVSHRGAHMNTTEVNIAASDPVGYRKFHFDNQTWYPSGPDNWTGPGGDGFLSVPATVKYRPLTEVIKTFCIMPGDRGLAAYYHNWHPESDWNGRVQIEGPDLYLMTPAIVAWNGNDTQLDIFVVSRANNNVLHAFWDYEVDQCGDTTILGQPDAISIMDERVDVFARGKGSEMLHKSFNASSKSWEPQNRIELFRDSVLSGPPRSTSDAPRYIHGPGSYGGDEHGQIHVFAYDIYNQLIWKTFNTAGTSSSDVVALADVPMKQTATLFITLMIFSRKWFEMLEELT
ncbi:fucose-specific lectin [Biscogniauxia marginata]|nr:fucose-specific lectin [Biscogniauxia marginata]